MIYLKMLNLLQNHLVS
uniref:Uncharacterized protein n=1 Tax=Arundo donax TaxID=35708 RepID=A0A0A9HP81_ARUDO